MAEVDRTPVLSYGGAAQHISDYDYSGATFCLVNSQALDRSIPKNSKQGRRLRSRITSAAHIEVSESCRYIPLLFGSIDTAQEVACFRDIPESFMVVTSTRLDNLKH